MRVVSRRGSVEAPVRVDPALRPGLAFMTLHFQDDVPVNQLTIDATDPKSGTAEFKATAIRIEKLGARAGSSGAQPRCPARSAAALRVRSAPASAAAAGPQRHAAGSRSRIIRRQRAIVTRDPAARPHGRRVRPSTSSAPPCARATTFAPGRCRSAAQRRDKRREAT